MTDDTIAELRARRLNLADELAGVETQLLDAVIDKLETDPDVNLTALAKRAGVARATVYNELARRQQTRDGLSSNGAPPPAPADEDDPEPVRPLTPAQRRALEAIRRGEVSLGKSGLVFGGPQGGVRGDVYARLRERGLVVAGEAPANSYRRPVRLTRIGALELEGGRRR